MTRDVLDFSKSYEWIGRFWFPNDEENIIKEFSGKATFSPGGGISLTLIGAEKSYPDYTKKIMHAIVQGEHGQVAISLLNVVLNESVISRGITLTGSASALVQGKFVDSHAFSKMMFQYDDHFENIFLVPQKKERNALRYGRSSPILINDDFKISPDTQGWSTFLSEDDFESMFVSRNESDIEKLKDAVRPLLVDKKIDIWKRLETHFQIIFDHENSLIWDFLSVESKWRLYWELLIDHPINVKRSFVLWQGKTESGVDSRRLLPCLYLSEVKKGRITTAKDTLRLPINFHSFSLGAYNFDILQEPIKRWLEIGAASNWESIFDGIRHFVKSNDDFADSTKYISLIADIETFLDLMGENKSTVDRLIELYGYPEWEKSLRALPIDILSGDSLGVFLSKIRRVIVHPKGCSKIDGGRYKGIISDELLLHKIYAHLSALLMKAIVEFVGGVSKEAIEKFTNEIIYNRCAYSTIIFED